MKKRWLSVLVILTMIISFIPSYGTHAAEGGPTVELGNPRYVAGSTTEVYFPDVTVLNSTAVKTVIVSVNTGSINKTNTTPEHTMTDRATDGGHKIYVWICPDAAGWDIAYVETLIESLTYTYTEGMYVYVTVDSNEVKGDYKQEGIYITNNIREANGHYYMYVPYNADEEALLIDEPAVAVAKGKAGYKEPTWTQAYNKSKAFTFMGMSGYLATIADLEESALLHDINNKAGWCAGTMLTYADGQKIADDRKEITDVLKTPAGTDGPVEADAETNRKFYYWACGPEAGQPVATGLWGANEPNYNMNPDNDHISGATLAPEFVGVNPEVVDEQRESCVIANYESKPYLNDIKEGNYSDMEAGIDNNGDGIIQTWAARAFGYFVEFGGYTLEDNKAQKKRAFQSKVVSRLTVGVDVSNGNYTCSATDIWPGEEVTATITAGTDYHLPDSITVTVGGTTLTENQYTWNKDTGVVVVTDQNVTGDVLIDVDCIPDTVNAKVTVGNGSALQNNVAIEENVDKTINKTDNYTVTISPDTGYRLPESISVTVDGKPLDDTQYTYNKTTGVVTITSDKITGNVVIDAACETNVYTATGTVTDGSFDGSSTATPGEDYTATIEADDGYELPEEITVKIGGKVVDSSDYTWDQETGEVTIPGVSVTGDIEIIAVCEETFTVEDDITNGTFDGSDTAKPGEDYTATITPDDGYDLPPEITVTVDGDELDSDDYTWDPETGEVTIDGDKITGDIEITATCVKIVTKDSPSTGDNSNTMLYFMIMLLALAGLAGCTIYKVKNR